MPALRLFGRRWMLSSDDIPILAFFPTIFHGAWCIALFVGWVVLNRPSDCREGARYTVALAGLGFTFLGNFILGILLIHEGLKGSIFEVKKRWRVQPILTADFFLLVLELAFVIYGTVVLYMTPPDCLMTNKELWSPNGIMNVMIWTTWGILIISFILLVITYNFFPDFQNEKSWEHRCKCVTMICCCQCSHMRPHGGKKQNRDESAAPYTRLAALFSQVFGLVDLVPSDVLASFLLAAAMQRADRGSALKSVLSNHETHKGMVQSERDSPNLVPRESANSETAILDHDNLRQYDSTTLFTPSGMAPRYGEDMDVEEVSERHARHWELDPVSDHDLNEAAHYCRYAFAAYGYLLYIWAQPQYKGWCGLCCGRRFGLWTSPMRRYFEAFTAANFMPDIKINNAMNREAMQQMTGLDDRDIVFVRYVGQAKDRHCLPYFIAVDQSTESVVISIRGTLSLEDCLTDFMCEPADINEWMTAAPAAERSSFDDDTPEVQLASRGDTITAHAGILEAAKAVVKDIQETGELRGLMENRMPQSRAPSPLKSGVTHPTHDCREWRIVITGHSLGAGVAVLVALYVRKYFKRVFCWAFSPPGGLAEPSVAEAARSFCTSVALGKDWIPRLTLGSFEHLRDEMIIAAARCKISKTAFLLGLLRGKRWDNKEHKLFCRPEEAEMPEEARELIATYRRSMQRSTTARDRYRMARTFILPGRLMYLRPLKHKPHVKKKRRIYDAVWAKAEDLHGEGIMVSPRMMADHMPDYVTSVLGRLARDRRRENPDLLESHGPAVGSGAENTTGPSRSHMAIDIDSSDSESESEEAAEDESELKRDR